MLARENTIQIIIQELAPSPAPIICIQQKQQHKTNTNIIFINEVSLISHFGISRITLQLYHTKIKILV
jgi:hypothetical protein